MVVCISLYADAVICYMHLLQLLTANGLEHHQAALGTTGSIRSRFKMSQLHNPDPTPAASSRMCVAQKDVLTCICPSATVYQIQETLGFSDWDASTTCLTTLIALRKNHAKIYSRNHANKAHEEEQKRQQQQQRQEQEQ